MRGGFDPTRFFELARKVGHGRALGIEYRGSGDDWVELALPWREELVGVPESGILASGAIVSLIDTAGGTSVWMALGNFSRSSRIDLRLDYLRPGAQGRNGHRPLRMLQADPADRLRPRHRAWRRSGAADRAQRRHVHARRPRRRLSGRVFRSSALRSTS